MCGRVTLDFDIEMLKDILEGALNVEQLNLDKYSKRYNIAPGQEVLSIINDGEINRAGFMKWGFVPSFADSPNVGNKMINARGETIDQKPSFKQPFLQKRCVILADSFYEWAHFGRSKTPYRIMIKDRPIMPMAGIWSKYTLDDGNPLFTCAIVTTAANDMMKRIHDRMPVILTPETYNVWLNKTIKEPQQLKAILTPYATEAMTMYPVRNLVNNVRMDGPELIKALDSD